MKRKALRTIFVCAIVAVPLVLGAAVHTGGSLQARSGDCWRFDREQCVGCGACWAMYDWVIEEGPDGFPRFIDPNECGTVFGADQETIVVDPACEQLFHEIDDSLPYDACIEPCD